MNVLAATQQEQGDFVELIQPFQDFKQVLKVQETGFLTDIFAGVGSYERHSMFDVVLTMPGVSNEYVFEGLPFTAIRTDGFVRPRSIAHLEREYDPITLVKNTEVTISFVNVPYQRGCVMHVLKSGNVPVALVSRPVRSDDCCVFM